MTPKTWLAIACLVAGVLIAAYSLAERQLLPAFGGFALIFTFVYLMAEAMSKAGKPTQSITPAADAAWKMKDAPAADSRRGDRDEAPR
jgi:hypothetical protein